MLLPLVLISISSLVHGAAAEDCRVPYISNGRIEEQVQEPKEFDWWPEIWPSKMKYKKIPMGFIPSIRARLFLVCQQDDPFTEGVSRIEVTCSDGKWSQDLVCLKTTCQDPGPIANGKAKSIGSANNFFDVGASIEFSCKDQYYLNGEKSISCTTNGIWSAKKPECVKVNLEEPPKHCKNPPVPRAGFVTYLAPLETLSYRRLATYQSRLSPFFRPALSSHLADSMHEVGTTATYECESRYYELIGSKARRCEVNGKWSGRPPICMPVCGRSYSQRSTFIANGNSTNIGQWPWQVRIVRDDDQWIYSCGASLLNEVWVITAAHCVTKSGTVVIHNPDEFQAYMGKYYRGNSKDDEYVQVKKILEIHIHPDYDPHTIDADIALMQLDSPVELNTRVQPICLPTEQTTRENLVEGKKGVVTGWGKDEKGEKPDILQQAVLPFVSKEKCIKGFKDSKLDYTVTDNMFCAGYADGRSDSCSGDSGGPMAFIDPTSKERRWVLEGIVSWGSSNGCAKPNQYGVYTTVSKFLDWIHLYV